MPAIPVAYGLVLMGLGVVFAFFREYLSAFVCLRGAERAIQSATTDFVLAASSYMYPTSAPAGPAPRLVVIPFPDLLRAARL